MRAPGIVLLTRPRPTIVARTAIETTRVGTFVWVGIAGASSTNFCDGAAALAGDPEHAADLAHRDLDADAGQEADEHAARQEVGDEPELQEARDDEQRRRTSSAASDAICDVLRRLGDRGPCASEAGRQDRRRRRVGADDEVARRAEEREQRRPAGASVYRPVIDRHAGDLGVAHDLGDRQGRERRAGDDVDR